MIIVVFGLPGTGKSYFAERLAKKLDARRLSTDILRKTRFPEAHYTEQDKMQVYGMLIQAVRLHAAQSENIVVDGTFYKAEVRETFSWTANKLGDELKFIEVKADEKVVKQRTSKEREDSDADYEVYLKVKEEFEPMKDEHLVLTSTNDNVGKMLEEAVHYLENEKSHTF